MSNAQQFAQTMKSRANYSMEDSVSARIPMEMATMLSNDFDDKICQGIHVCLKIMSWIIPIHKRIMQLTCFTKCFCFITS